MKIFMWKEQVCAFVLSFLSFYFFVFIMWKQQDEMKSFSFVIWNMKSL